MAMVALLALSGQSPCPPPGRLSPWAGCSKALRPMLEPFAPSATTPCHMFGIRTNSPFDLHTAAARHLKPAATREGVPVVSWHDLRHTYATWGRRTGIKPEAMRDHLGHTSVRMTLDVYGHAQDVAGEGAIIEQYAWPETRQGVLQ